MRRCGQAGNQNRRKHLTGTESNTLETRVKGPNLPEARLSGKQLIEDVNGCRPGNGEMCLWWLGQLGFIIKVAGKAIYVDAYLAPDKRRRVPPLLKPEEITNADIVMGTHNHSDHIDKTAWPGIAAASPRAKFVVPELLLTKLAEELRIPVERFVGMDDGKSADVGGVKVTGVAAAHEFLDRDEKTGRYPYLGYVVEAGGMTLYHAGDTCKYEGLETKLKKWAFDVIMVPINGRDAARLSRNCIGNMVYQEAADLAGALKPRLTIPGHYDMFEGNSENPQLFIDYMKVKYPVLKTAMLIHGSVLVLKR
jgi:L-ascorbate 6-phosphate lactonase